MHHGSETLRFHSVLTANYNVFMDSVTVIYSKKDKMMLIFLFYAGTISPTFTCSPIHSFFPSPLLSIGVVSPIMGLGR